MLVGSSRSHVAVELAEVESTEGHSNYLVQALNRVIEANTKAQREYVPRRYDGTAVLFRASVPFSEPYKAPHLGWNLLFAPGRIDDFVVPGDHSGITDEPSVHILARHLDRRLREAEAQHVAAADATD